MRKAVLFAVACLLLSSIGFAAPPFNRMESVCFYLPDGKTINLSYVHQPHRGDNLEIRSALLETAMHHRAAVIRGEKKATGWEDRMVLSAMTEQWTEGGLSCDVGVSRSGGKMYVCHCNGGGSGCTRVIVQNGAGPVEGPMPPPDGSGDHGGLKADR